LNISQHDPEGRNARGTASEGAPTDGFTGLQTRLSMQTRHSLEHGRLGSISHGANDRIGLMHAYDVEEGFGLEDLTDDSEIDRLSTKEQNGKRLP